MYDIIIIGGGPAGLTAAIYARRANKTVLVIEKETFGGQITFSPKVENIPGFISVTGNEFAEKLVEQAMEQGADVEMAEVLEIQDVDNEFKTVITDNGKFVGHAIIFATGTKHKTLHLKNEEQFIGNGISFCAVCDGAFYKDKTVGVVGGGNSALQEAILLSDLAKKVYIIQNLETLTGEAQLQEQLKSKDNIKIIYNHIVSEYLGDTALTGITIKDPRINITENIELDGLFLAVGLEPQNENFKNALNLNVYGYVYGTKNKGIFAAGDCCENKIRQVVTACADGAAAALKACDYIDKLKTGKI